MLNLTTVLNSINQMIDYWLSKFASLDNTILISLGALFASLIALVVSLYTFYKQYKEGHYTYLATLWNNILDTCYENPQFLDVTTTENYTSLPNKERQKYEAFCWKAWSLVEDIVEKGFHKHRQFSHVVQWVVQLHWAWLDTNPVFFPLERFWKAVTKARKEQYPIRRYKPLPQKNGAIDWEKVAPDYHKYILGPFAPPMVELASNGRRRNLLLEELLAISQQELSDMEIADFGCGPGNLLPHLAGRVKRLVGVDADMGVLKIAGKVAEQNDIAFTAIHGDMCALELGRKFDLIICANSILPDARGDVLRILRCIRGHLKQNGQLWAIMPSFDTTEFLRGLWYKHYRKRFRSRKHARRLIEFFDRTKRFNPEILSYADDGVVSQCYHTPKSMVKEFKGAGLRILGVPRKLRYPWELTKKFDYGDFPNAKEEIWDWFIKATRDDAPAR